MWLQPLILLSFNDTYTNHKSIPVDIWYIWESDLEDESVSLNGDLFGAPKSFTGRCLEKDLTPENFRPVCPASTLDIVDDLDGVSKVVPL